MNPKSKGVSRFCLLILAASLAAANLFASGSPSYSGLYVGQTPDGQGGFALYVDANENAILIGGYGYNDTNGDALYAVCAVGTNGEGDSDTSGVSVSFTIAQDGTVAVTGNADDGSYYYQMQGSVVSNGAFLSAAGFYSAPYSGGETLEAIVAPDGWIYFSPPEHGGGSRAQVTAYGQSATALFLGHNQGTDTLSKSGVLTIATSKKGAYRLYRVYLPPSGSVTNQITGSTNVLWDFSRLTNELQQLDLNIEKVSGGDTNAVEILYDDPFVQGGRGRLSGSGATTETLIQYPSADHDAGTNIFDADYITSGSVTSSKGVARVIFTSKTSGKTALSQGGQVRLISVAATLTVKVDANNNLITGRSVKMGAASGHGSISQSSILDPHPILPDLAPELGDGTWTLVLTFTATSASKLSGTASVTLNGGTVYPFNFTGAYTAKTGQSRLDLNGVDAGKGSVLHVTLQGSNVLQITGQVAGQRVSVRE